MRDEAGFALITVVLLMIGLAVLATGLVFAASQQSSVVASMHDLARARRGAEAAVAIALAEWNAWQRSTDSPGETVLFTEAELEPGLGVGAMSERIAGSTFLITGTGHARRGSLRPIRQTATRIVRSLDVDSIGRALDAALVAGRIRIDAAATVRGSAGRAPDETGDSAPACPAAADGAALRAPLDSVHVAPGAVVAGAPALVIDPDPARLREGLGHLGFETLAARGRTLRSPTVAPGPVLREDTCDAAAPLNWGAPSGPCDSLRVLVHAAGPLRVDGGYGAGVLLAAGDLVLDGGMRFRGLVIARGAVTIRDAVVDGAVIAHRLHMEGGEATLDRCAIIEALAGIAELKAADTPPRSWIPAFD